MTATVLVDRDARSFLREADPVLARVIDAQPDFQPRARLDMLPRLSYFGTLIFQVTGGIGPWTAHGFLIVALDRPDVLLSGDLALRRAVQRAYGFDHVPTEGERVSVAERWRPYRSLAVSYLFASD
jgi:hypothetical protein